MCASTEYQWSGAALLSRVYELHKWRILRERNNTLLLWQREASKQLRLYHASDKREFSEIK